MSARIACYQMTLGEELLIKLPDRSKIVRVEEGRGNTAKVFIHVHHHDERLGLFRLFWNQDGSGLPDDASYCGTVNTFSALGITPMHLIVQIVRS